MASCWELPKRVVRRDLSVCTLGRPRPLKLRHQLQSDIKGPTSGPACKRVWKALRLEAWSLKAWKLKSSKWIVETSLVYQIICWSWCWKWMSFIYIMRAVVVKVVRLVVIISPHVFTPTFSRFRFSRFRMVLHPHLCFTFALIADFALALDCIPFLVAAVGSSSGICHVLTRGFYFPRFLFSTGWVPRL